ncbi:MAG: elongation factor 1-beta [Candidatus Nezhaarchaeales archaeon]
MGEVVALVKIMPAGVEVDLDRLKERLKEALPKKHSIKGFKEEPIAFGIKALKVYVLMPEEAGGTSSLEEAFQRVEGVGQVEVELVFRV